MELGKQIKKYRNEQNLSQEELAEQIYVSRQTISNWENDKNYPDIKSLLLMSQFFGVSLDHLVKGDLEEMKVKIQEEDVRKFKKDGGIFTGLLIAVVVLAVPLVGFGGWAGVGIWGILAAVTFYQACRIERQKKHYDIQTYREIAAFYEGQTLDEIDRQREYGKRPYQKFLLVLGSALIGLAASVGMLAFMQHFVG